MEFDNYCPTMLGDFTTKLNETILASLPNCTKVQFLSGLEKTVSAFYPEVISQLKNSFTVIPIGFLMGLMLASFYGLDYRIQKDAKKIKGWFFYKDPIRLLLIFLVVTTRMGIGGFKEFTLLSGKDFGLVAVSAICDYIGVFFMGIGSRYVPLHVIGAFNQSLFIFNNLFEFLVYGKTPDFLFCGIATSFLLSNYSYFSKGSHEKRTPKQYAIGSLCGVVATSGFMGSMQIQTLISRGFTNSLYYFYGVPCMLLTSLGFSLTFDRKNIPKSCKDVKTFYKKKWSLALGSSIAGAVFYVTGGDFMTRFSPLLLNLCTIPFPAFNILVEGTIQTFNKIDFSRFKCTKRSQKKTKTVTEVEMNTFQTNSAVTEEPRVDEEVEVTEDAGNGENVETTQEVEAEGEDEPTEEVDTDGEDETEEELITLNAFSFAAGNIGLMLYFLPFL